MTSSGHAHLCRWSSWRTVSSLNGINQVILSPWLTTLSCVMPTLHNGPNPSHRNCPFSGGRGCRSPSNTIWHWMAKANRRALQNGISIQSSCLSWQLTSVTDIQDGRTEIPVAVLDLGCWVESISFLLFSAKSCWIFQSLLEGVDRASLLWLVKSSSNSAALGDWNFFM